MGASARRRLIADPGLEPGDADVVQAALLELDAAQEDALDALASHRGDGGTEDGHDDEGGAPRAS